MKKTINLPVQTTESVEITIPSFRKDSHIDLFYAIISEELVIEVLLGKLNGMYFISNTSLEKACNSRTTEISKSEFQDAMDMAMAIITEQRRKVKEAIV